MDSNDTAEIRMLIDTCLLTTLANSTNKNNRGLYRDDGLILLRNCKGPKNIKLENRSYKYQNK